MHGPQLDHKLIRTLHGRARADRWGVSVERFAEALTASAGRTRAAGAAPAGDLARELTSLHLEDLALACACADGHDGAWEHFIREYRPGLYRAADAIDASGGARELADALYGELFGLVERDGQRRSLFRYFHGRSSLATWIRAVLAQRHVDGIRRTRRLEPLPEEPDAVATPAGHAPPHPERPRFLALMRAALGAAVARLSARDRLRLACYYAQDLTLAQIGRTLGEHEATASRHLARTRRAVREDVERQLRQDHRMSEDAISECFSSVVEDAGTLDIAEMLAMPARKELGSDRST